MTRLSAEREREARALVAAWEANERGVRAPIVGNPFACLFDALAELDALRAENERLKAFARDVLKRFPESAPDEFEIQEIAVKHGLLIAHQVKEACGENCWCAEYHGDFNGGVTCYRRDAALAETKP